MDIGTAKPTPAERRKVRHHLIDLISPRSEFSVHEYRRRALEAITKIQGRGKIPLVVGGSGLYLHALWKGLSNYPGRDRTFRRRLEQEADLKGVAGLYRRLRKIDSERAEKIHSHDRRRIIRALEIAAVLGTGPRVGHRSQESLEDLGFSVQVIGIQRERADLYGRINQRVKAMFRKGFLKEVGRLQKKGLSKTARQALGYKEALTAWHQGSRLRHGRATPELVPLIQTRTRQFAKRQLTWFRREKGIEWVDWAPGESARAVCDKIMMQLSAPKWPNFLSAR